MNTSAQQKKPGRHSNIFFAEAGGVGGLGALGYERCFLREKPFYVSVYTGLSTYRLLDFYRSFNPDIIIPIGGRAFWGLKQHHFFAGLGITYNSVAKASVYSDQVLRDRQWNLHASTGYRYAFCNQQLFIQAAFTPVWETDYTVKLWGGFAFGYSF